VISNQNLARMLVYRRGLLSACRDRACTINELYNILSDFATVHRATINGHLTELVARKWLLRSVRKEATNTGPKPYQYLTSEAGLAQLRLMPKETPRAGTV
jgi:hypothetical protein